jgi:hypothetical protein
MTERSEVIIRLSPRGQGTDSRPFRRTLTIRRDTSEAVA